LLDTNPGSADALFVDKKFACPSTNDNWSKCLDIWTSDSLFSDFSVEFATNLEKGDKTSQSLYCQHTSAELSSGSTMVDMQVVWIGNVFFQEIKAGNEKK
jgi:hypothetical protein